LELPGATERHLRHARNFSEAMHGAALLYNLILAELLAKQEWIDTYREALASWVGAIEDGWERLVEWDVSDFWQLVATANGRIPIPTRSFIDGWLKVVRSSSVGSVADDDRARGMIMERERQLKRGLARVDGGRPLELFQGGAGNRQIDYRWKATARRMILDIQEGLARGTA
jgi:hypothetical protein